MASITNTDLTHIWHEAKSSLPDLADGRLFITGGTGFFGCWLLESLHYAQQTLGLKLAVVVLTRNSQAFARAMPHLANSPHITFHEGDVRNFTFPHGQFTHVIHAATEASAQLNREQPLVMLDTITQGTRRVLDFAVQSGVKKFLFTSSGAVYGRQPTDLSHVPETYLGLPDALSPESAYGIGKYFAEHLCALFAKQFNLPIKIARCFAFVGPYLPMDTHFAIGNFMTNALKNEPIHVKGHGLPYRSYLYAADLVIWLLTILNCGKTGVAYNVGSEQAISIAELAHLISHQVAPSLPVYISQTPPPNAVAERYVPSTERARCELNLREYISLEEAISRTIQWHAARATG